MRHAKRFAAVMTFLLVWCFPLMAKNQGKPVGIHFQNCKATPENAEASYHGDIVFWQFDGSVNNTDSLEIKFEHGSPCSNTAPIIVSNSGIGYCIVKSPTGSFKYSVYKGNVRCNDPTVEVKDGQPDSKGGAKKAAPAKKKSSGKDHP